MVINLTAAAEEIITRVIISFFWVTVLYYEGIIRLLFEKLASLVPYLWDEQVEIRQNAYLS